MKEKGVSPVIATVLLIGMVIVLGLIIFLWMRALAQETVTKFEGENIELACDKVQLEASIVGSQLTVSNLANTPIYDINVRIETPGVFETKRARDIFSNWPKYGLNQGGVFSGTASELNGAEIKITPILLGKSETGSQKTFTCNEKQHGKEVF